jgi:hypothetical protein
MQLQNDLARAARSSCSEAGEYRPLFKYLRDRYADRVVLTFGEIEDLLGFSLPESASLDPDWWDSAPTKDVSSAHSDAWRLADRTAVVNLISRRVIFDRRMSRDV